MNRTLSQVDTDLAALEQRVTQIDGIGLSPATQSEIAKLKALVAGARQSFREAVLLLESKLNDYQKTVDEVRAKIDNHLAA